MNGFDSDSYPQFLVRGNLNSIKIDFYDTAPSPINIPTIMSDANNHLIQNTMNLDVLVTNLFPDPDPPTCIEVSLPPSLKLLRGLATAIEK